MIKIIDRFCVVGPLTLDSRTNRAYTMRSEEMQFTPEEFNTLHLLALRENIPLTLEQLCEAAWNSDDKKPCKTEITKGLEKVINFVNGSGEGFMWINQCEENGYSFHTRWSGNIEDSPKQADRNPIKDKQSE